MGKEKNQNYDFYDFVHSVLPTTLPRKEFYRQVANLYRKTYSFPRYFKSIFLDLQRVYKKSDGSGSAHTDRLSFIKMLGLHAIGYPLYFKHINLYKDEPLISG